MSSILYTIHNTYTHKGHTAHTLANCQTVPFTWHWTKTYSILDRMRSYPCTRIYHEINRVQILNVCVCMCVLDNNKWKRKSVSRYKQKHFEHQPKFSYMSSKSNHFQCIYIRI